MVGGIERSTSRATNKLSDRAIKSFVSQTQKGADVKGKLADGGGLYLTVTAAGTLSGASSTASAARGLYSIGPYPQVTLAAARSARDEAKGLIRAGRDPVRARQVGRVEASAATDATFARVTQDWLAKQKRDWSEIHYQKSERAFERDVLPLLGRMPIAEISPAMVAAVIEGILKRDVRDMAGKVLQHIGGVFRFAQGRGLCRDNPAIPVHEILPKRRTIGRRPALLAFEALRDVMERAELAALSPSVRLAHRLCAFTAARVGNIVEAQWGEFDLESETPTWTIPRAKMKVREREHDHKAALGPTIVAELRLWKARTKGVGFVFPSPTGRDYITREPLEKARRVTLGLANKHSLHGWRAALSTLARDAGFSREVVELALDHIHDTAVARAYDRGERINERRRLMDWWDLQLQHPNADAKIVSIRSGAA